MKNFPHQFNNLDKLYNSLRVIRELINANAPLTDENFGEKLTREGIYTYRDQELTIDQFLASEQQKPAANRGYLTVARDIRRFFELLGFITVFPNKIANISPTALQLSEEESAEARKALWKNALLQLSLEGADGEVSHPYRILLKIVRLFPGIETSKLMLALEAQNDSDEEFERISSLVPLSLAEIIEVTGTSKYMAANAVKILPGIAEQLDDIERRNNRAYVIAEVVITEDEISTEEAESPDPIRVAYRPTTVASIARDPQLNAIASASVDLTEAIRLRQRRLAEHQELVRALGAIVSASGFSLFEGKFDCLGVKNNRGLLFEVKTLSGSLADEERQTVKGVGQLKFYDFSIVQGQMNLSNTIAFMAYSRRPSNRIIQFCQSENIRVIWKDGDEFVLYNGNNATPVFDPDALIN